MHYFDEDTDILTTAADGKPHASAKRQEMTAWVRSNIPFDDYNLYEVWVGKNGDSVPLSEYMKGKD